MKAQRRAGLSGKALLDDFGDDVADLVDMADGLGRQSGCVTIALPPPTLLFHTQVTHFPYRFTTKAIREIFVVCSHTY